jgi:hypothetical protein
MRRLASGGHSIYRGGNGRNDVAEWRAPIRPMELEERNCIQPQPSEAGIKSTSNGRRRGISLNLASSIPD